MTEIGTAATPVMFSEIDAHNWFPGGQPLVEHPEKAFFIVEAVVAASFFSQPRRDALQTAVAKVFVDILGDDGTVLERRGSKFRQPISCGCIPCSLRSLRAPGALAAERSTRS